MEKSTHLRYRLISAFLPENLEASFADTQRHLFRTTGLSWAQALPPFVPLGWCRDEAGGLSKFLTHNQKPDAAFLPVRTGGWLPPSSGDGIVSPAAAVVLHPTEGIKDMVSFFARRTEVGPSLFPGALGTLVLALAPAGARTPGATRVPGDFPPPVSASELPPAPNPVASKVLRLGLLELAIEERGISWEMYELGWLSRRDDG